MIPPIWPSPSYPGLIMKLSLYSHHSSTKWITLKCWAGCTQNGRDKMAADGSCGIQRGNGTVSEGARGLWKDMFILMLRLRPCYSPACNFLDMDFAALSWLWQEKLKCCNAGSKPQLSCSTAQNMKSKLINHRSLSCVWTNTQRRVKRCSSLVRVIHSQQKKSLPLNFDQLPALEYIPQSSSSSLQAKLRIRIHKQSRHLLTQEKTSDV